MIASGIGGFVLFALDLLLLAVLCRWLWRSNRHVHRYRLLVLLSVAKLPLLGGGVYLALVVLRLDLLAFVLGALVALVVISGLLVIRELGKPSSTRNRLPLR